MGTGYVLARAIAAVLTVSLSLAVIGRADASTAGTGLADVAGHPASTSGQLNMEGVITWMQRFTPEGDTGSDTTTGTFYVDLTDINGGFPRDGSQYSVTDNTDLKFVSGQCATTTTGGWSGSGSLGLTGPPGIGWYDNLPDDKKVGIVINVGFAETWTVTTTGPSECSPGSHTELDGGEAFPECFSNDNDPLSVNGTFKGKYPDGTVDVDCAGDLETATGRWVYSIGGTLTLSGQAACSGAPGKPKGSLKVTVSGADIVPPPKPANQTPQGAYFSIPRPGQRNAWQRYYDVYYTVTGSSGNVTAAADITKAIVDLDDASGASLQDNVVDEGPGPDGKVSVIACGAVKVQVSFSGDTTSRVESTPPPTNKISYKFTLSVRDTATGASGKSDAYTAKPVYALWKIPDGIPRYGGCDEQEHDAEGPGGDNWVSQSTYNWIVANRNLISAVNDTSFESGMNLGPHMTHGTGNDIDMFHVYTGLTGAEYPTQTCSGTVYYGVLVQTVRKALAGDAAAKVQVTNWVAQTRARFDQLLAMSQVRQIIYADGELLAPSTTLPGLPAHWAQKLLRYGTFTNAAGKTLTVAGVWANSSNSKMLYLSSHDNHVHLTLAACAAANC